MKGKVIKVSNVINTFPEKFRTDIEKATEILKKYGCSEIYIFGSIANGKFDEYSDIDIAVKGLNARVYFKVLAEMERVLFSEVDLIVLDDERDRFAQFILKEEELIKVG